jgi:glycosyltransferase involved in cell wall biosynthesis
MRKDAAQSRSRDQNGTPEVSVILSVFNGASFLADALESILCQTFTDFELIAVNDGSTDGSEAVLDTFAKRDTRVRVVHQPNRGLIFSLNRGLELSRGEFIARMDADDVSLPERLTKQVEFLRSNPQIALVGSSMTIIDANGGFLRDIHYPVGHSLVKSKMQEACSLAHPTIMARREVLRAMGGYRPSFHHAEDYDLWLRLIEHYEIDNLDEILLLYRQHGGNISVRYRQTQVLSSIFARECHRYRSAGLPDPLKDIVEPITLDMVHLLKLSNEAEAELRISLLKEGLSAPEKSGPVLWLVENLEWLWVWRPDTKNARFVRRVLVPAAAHFWKRNDYREARRWFRRALFLAPLNAVWATVRMAIRNGRNR